MHGVKQKWRKNSDLVEVYDHVIEEFDRFLAEHGYVREGAHYRVEKESDETVTVFLPFRNQLRAVVPFMECITIRALA